MKKIEVIHLKPSQLKHEFANPRKISKVKAEELKKSLEIFGDHGVIKIDPENNIIAGSQRIKAMIELGIDTPILCKKLIGYTQKELKAINVSSNTHSGEWDYDKLDDWGDELKDFDFIDSELKPFQEDKIKEKEVDILDTENKCPKCGYEY